MPISLFYHYADIDDVDGLASRLRWKGHSLNLGGRIRVSPEGINGTLGGPDDAVAEFHAQVLHEFNGAKIDFKLSEGSANDFASQWRVRSCEELVTVGTRGKQASWRDAAPHISATQFRDELLQKRSAVTCTLDDVLVLDARNEYEHAIGRFDGALLPHIRQFSDFAQFVHDEKHVFRGKRVLMYCTGGVRCERGSAVVRKFTDAASVAQLQGGIDAFLKQFPDGGGLFRGKNLVFDRRMAVGNCDGGVVGKCICCAGPWDDYSSQWRCGRCRIRVLLCDSLKCAEDWKLVRRVSCRVCYEE